MTNKKNPQPSKKSYKGGHPDGHDLYNFFSLNPAEDLSLKEREEIADHVALCRECAEFGKDIQKGDMVLDTVLATPETEEDKVALRRSLQWFHTEITESLVIFKERTIRIKLPALPLSDEVI